MRRPVLVIIILLLFTISAAGCGYEVLQRKFIRKKKKPAGPPAVYHVQPFVKPPNAEIYSHAFLMWKINEDELLIALKPDGYPRVINNLKVKDCLKEAVVNLGEMKTYLNAKLAQELEPYIAQLQQMVNRLDTEESSDMFLARIRQDVETHKRNVDIRFHFRVVKNDLTPDSVGAEESQASQKE